MQKLILLNDFFKKVKEGPINNPSEEINATFEQFPLERHTWKIQKRKVQLTTCSLVNLNDNFHNTINEETIFWRKPKFLAHPPNTISNSFATPFSILFANTGEENLNI